MPEAPLSSPDYSAWLGDLKSRIDSARTTASRAVNRELVALYWDIGEDIVAKQAEHGWGASVIDRLSGDLQAAFPSLKGFSPRNLRDMKRLVTVYSEESIWRQAVANFMEPRPSKAAKYE